MNKLSAVIKCLSGDLKALTFVKFEFLFWPIGIRKNLK